MIESFVQQSTENPQTEVTQLFTSPTERWIKSEEHAVYDNGLKAIKAHNSQGLHIEVNEGWTEQQLKSIPLEQCIEQEKEYLSTHVSLYHATKKMNYALDLFCRYIQELCEGTNHVSWVRSLHSHPGGMKYENIEQIKRAMSQADTVDTSNHKSWHLLSCNPTLLQNSDYDSDESTIDYFFNNQSVLEHPFYTIFSKLLDNLNSFPGQTEVHQSLYQKLSELVSDGTYGEQGAIYQYLIPHDLLNELAYISKKNGLLDLDNTDALNTLIQLKTTDATVPNHNTLQVRLFVPKLLDTELAKQITVINHLNMTKDLHNQFKQEVFSLAKKAYEGRATPTVPVVDNPNVSASRNGYSFNFFSTPQTSKVPVSPGDTPTFQYKSLDDNDFLFSDAPILFDEEENELSRNTL